MNAVTLALPAETRARGESLWRKAARKFGRDRLGMLALGVVLAYFIVALGAWLGWWAGGWADLSGTKWEPVSSTHWFGTNIIGQDIFDRAVFSTATAFEVGLSVALAATLIGADEHRLTFSDFDGGLPAGFDTGANKGSGALARDAIKTVEPAA